MYKRGDTHIAINSIQPDKFGPKVKSTMAMIAANPKILINQSP